MVGTAVARIVASIATRLVVVMSAMSTGPRSERKPTSARLAKVTRSQGPRRAAAAPNVRGPGVRSGPREDAAGRPGGRRPAASVVGRQPAGAIAGSPVTVAGTGLLSPPPIAYSSSGESTSFERPKRANPTSATRNTAAMA